VRGLEIRLKLCVACKLVIKRNHIAIPFVILTATHAAGIVQTILYIAISCKVVRGLSCVWLVSYEKEAYSRS
jgi:AmiR/NasT family two-component response regulator